LHKETYKTVQKRALSTYILNDSAKTNIYETFMQLLDWSDQKNVKNIRVI